MEKLKVSPIGDPGQADRRRTAWRTRDALLGGAALVAAGLIVWRFWDGRGDLLKPDGGPLVTVMDFGRNFRSTRSPLAGNTENSGRAHP